ncbi:helix-turn-helix domain-containing protein [Bacteroides eggerthii]|jgi:putative araC family transcriptional regulator|uniref:helix-turn-helix domain-containing protein n=1 Tax=Bacteroides eggerthii TaxID=28111 RepID=UPI0018A0423C|nr:AraC family transcriptional regulator [Bacteroides eggerthii]
MELFYLQEHISCNYYKAEMKVGFRYLEAGEGEFRNEDSAGCNYLIFVLEGSLTVSIGDFLSREVETGEMFFVAKASNCYGRVLKRARLVILCYENVAHLCDKTLLMSLKRYCVSEQDFLGVLPINEVLEEYMQLMVTYLRSGGNCVCFHEIKLRELFWVLRAFYKKEDLASLFYVVLGHSAGFRDRVFSNYRKAGTALELARLCGYSRQRFGKLFMEEFGTSPFAWMQEQMMQRIKARLADKNVPLKDIVWEFNLSSMPHLVRLCKKSFLKTPAEMRRELLDSAS